MVIFTEELLRVIHFVDQIDFVGGVCLWQSGFKVDCCGSEFVGCIDFRGGVAYGN